MSRPIGYRSFYLMEGAAYSHIFSRLQHWQTAMKWLEIIFTLLDRPTIMNKHRSQITMELPSVRRLAIDLSLVA